MIDKIAQYADYIVLSILSAATIGLLIYAYLRRPSRRNDQVHTGSHKSNHRRSSGQST